MRLRQAVLLIVTAERLPTPSQHGNLPAASQQLATPLA